MVTISRLLNGNLFSHALMIRNFANVLCPVFDRISFGLFFVLVHLLDCLYMFLLKVGGSLHVSDLLYQ